MVVIEYVLNGAKCKDDIPEGSTLLEHLRAKGCFSVKCGCETSNCGLCTVWLDRRPVLSCSVPAMRIEGREVITLEGLQEEAAGFGKFMARQGADQCGFCNPGFMMNVLAMVDELDDPDEQQINEYLAGNLCRCTGYVSHMRAIKAFIVARQAGEEMP